MRTITAVQNRILQLCAERNLTINQLAALSALPLACVQDIVDGKSQDPEVVTIKKLCEGLNLSLSEFFSAPVFDLLETEIE